MIDHGKLFIDHGKLSDLEDPARAWRRMVGIASATEGEGKHGAGGELDRRYNGIRAIMGTVDYLRSYFSGQNPPIVIELPERERMCNALRRALIWNNGPNPNWDAFKAAAFPTNGALLCGPAVTVLMGNLHPSFSFDGLRTFAATAAGDPIG